MTFGYMLFLALAAALGGILFGYDTAVISGTVSIVSAQFGLTAASEGWYVGCALIGSIAGVAVAGVLCDKLGRKPTMIISAILFTVSAIGCAICSTFTGLVVYRIVGGVGIGVVSIASPLYISEVSEAKYRGRMVSLYQLAITIGFLLAYLANFAILKQAESGRVFANETMNLMFSEEIWRGMLGSETLPAALFLIILFFLPESSRWLALRTTRNSNDAPAQQKENTKSEWALLFKKPFSVALLAGTAIAILGQFMGVNAVLYYGPTIFEDAGLSSSDSLFSQVLVGVVNMLTTVIALFIIDKVGRKKLIYYGVSGMILCLLCIGLYFLFGNKLGISSVVLLVFFLLYVFCCAISISAVVWVLLSEMYPAKVRGTAMSISGFALWVGTYLIGQLTPIMLESLTPAGTFFLFGFMCIPYIVIMHKYIPETAGKSLEEIEDYWQNRIK